MIPLYGEIRESIHLYAPEDGWRELDRDPGRVDQCYAGGFRATR
jgi:hypothetical protein